MSKNITIQETGVAKKLSTISEIETAEQGGGSITWVPEAEHKVMKKTITAKGKYKAKDDNVYAYSEVVVNLSGSAKAKDKDKKPFTTIAPDITIQEGGVGKKMYNIKKLSVSVTNSDDTCSWVPEDNVKTDTLSVSGNGTFKASEHGCYGWTEVTVSKKAKKIIHKDDGNDYAVYEDDTEEKIPSSIKVTTPPDKTTYIAYEPIDTAGMVVTAYYGDGTEYGEIPREEYTIDPLVAEGGSGSDIYTDENGIVARRFKQSITEQSGRSYTHYWWLKEGDYPESIYTSGNSPTPQECYMYATFYNGKIYLAFVGSLTQTVHFGYGRTSGTMYHTNNQFAQRFTDEEMPSLKAAIPTSTANPNSKDASELVSVGEKITVTWVRPEDETELTDTFDITVNDPTPII